MEMEIKLLSEQLLKWINCGNIKKVKKVKNAKNHLESEGYGKIC